MTLSIYQQNPSVQSDGIFQTYYFAFYENLHRYNVPLAEWIPQLTWLWCDFRNATRIFDQCYEKRKALLAGPKENGGRKGLTQRMEDMRRAIAWVLRFYFSLLFVYLLCCIIAGAKNAAPWFVFVSLTLLGFAVCGTIIRARRR